ncbi:hypothetical protein V8E53_007852 [Lactarius tabidus]
MKTTKATSWERSQQTIDVEIKSLEESTRTLNKSIGVLKHRRNAHTPISSLPPEVFAAIFSFVCLPGVPSLGKKPDYNLARIRLSHVCHQWREIALNQPLLWNHVDFTTLSLAGATEMLVRAKSAPLYLEARRASWRRWETRWDGDRFGAFRAELRARIPQICHLTINAKPYYLRKTLAILLVSPAPTLKYLSLFSRGVSNGRDERTWDDSESEVDIPDTLFDGAAPGLSCLKLRNCDISWKSPHLKGLEYLRILMPSKHARPNLVVWLDALNEMPQLKTLTLHSASPIALSFPFDVERTVTLPSLTHLDMSASMGDCALALAHLDLPALTWLCLKLTILQRDSNVTTVQGALPYVARHGHGPQDIQPLQSILIHNEYSFLNILAWPVPDIDVEVYDPPALLGATVPYARGDLLSVNFTLLGSPPCDTGRDLELTDYSRPCALQQDLSRQRQQFWLRHLPKWPLLRRVRLASHVERGFIEALLEDNGGRESPLLPSLTELVLSKGELRAPWTCCLCDAMMKRVEQGVPLEILDLCMYHRYRDDSAAIRSLSEIVVDVLEPSFRGGPEEELDATAKKTRRMTALWEHLTRGPFAEDENKDKEDDDGE